MINLLGRFGLTILAVSLLLFGDSADADTYKCDAVDKLARLGYDGSSKVSIVGKDKVCKFSIGGASADGRPPPPDFELRRQDRFLLGADPDQFISQRLVAVFLEAAADLGEPADFVADGMSNDTDLSTLSCETGDSIAVDDLKIRCLRLDADKSDNPLGFENGIITALLFKPMFVFEILDTKNFATALVVFIPPIAQ